LNLGGRRIFSCRRLLTVAAAAAGMLGAAGCGTVGSPSTGGSSGAGTSDSTAGVLATSSTKVSFGNVAVGTSTAQLVTLTDAGKANVTISTVSATGSGFSASGESNVILTPNQSVTVSVNFGPTAVGGVQGTLLVSSNASNAQLQIGLTGSGTAQSPGPSVTLRWQPSASEVIGYFIYRGMTEGALSKLTSSVDPSTSFTDSTVAGGQTYVYAVTSVDSENVESARSAAVSVTIPSQ
jgi:hypothetical protein